jgi:thiosulfate/3-mercaptopyruvate sulfurtransferase
MSLPLLIEADELEPLLGSEGLQLVDLCKDTTYTQLHLPGAVHLPYGEIVVSQELTHGLLPDPAQLEKVFSAYGIGNETHVVAYDDEGGGNASRLLWTLAAMGHENFSLLNGGLHAWANERHPLSREPVSPTTQTFTAAPNMSVVAETEQVLEMLEQEDLALWDARSLNEYQGVSRFSLYPGHIPGAVHLDWLEVMDRKRNLRLKPKTVLQQMLNDLGLTPDKQLVAYCQTHHRSSLAWLVLKYLGYPNALGYHGSWSDWGNREDTPKAP